MSQRQYDMLFKLNAQMGSQYSSTFKQASSAMQQFQAEYRNLSKSANDISAYQRQQSAVENTRAKLELLQTQYDNIQREMDETGGFSSDLANKLATKQSQIDKTTKAYQDQIARLEEYKRRLQEAGVDTSHLDQESERLKRELEQLRSGFKEAGDEGQKFGERGAAALQDISNIMAAVGITKALKEIYEAFSACVEVSADFEASMSNVEAISGANGEQIGALTERAKELGATTAFTAQQVSEGMSYMAMAGWDTNSMLAGMDSVLALAAASGEDLGTVSDIVTDALTAFGLKASDTGRFADVLAAAATNANTNVGMMGETFKYAAPVAGALGYSVEDVAVAVGLMANSGIKASQAGTTLRNIFNGLLGGVDLTSEAFGEMEVSFVNADGTMMDLASSMSTLRGYFEQMTEAERVQNAVNIAGQRGYSGLLAILNSTTEDYDKLTNAINNSSGAAQKMADIKLDNLNGQMTIAKSAFEGLEIAVGEQFQPTLTRMYSTFAELTGSFTDFVKENPGVVKAIAAMSIGIGAFAAAIAVAKVAMIAFNAICAMNPYVLLAEAILAVVVALGTWAMMEEEAIDPMEELVSTSQEQADQLEDLRAQYDAVAEAEGETSVNAILLQRQIEEQTAAFESGKQTLQEYLDAHKAIYDAHDSLISDYQETTKAITQDQEGAESLIFKLQELASKASLSSGELQVLQAVIEELNELLPDANITYDVSTGKLNITTEDLQAMAQATAEARQQAEDLDAYIASIQEHETLQKTAQEAKAAYDAQKRQTEAAEEAWEASKKYYDSVNGQQMTSDTGLWERWQAESAALQTLQGDLDAANDALAENEALQNQLSESITGYADATEAAGATTNSVGDVLDSYKDRIHQLTDAYTEAYAAAKDSIEGQYKIWDDVAAVNATSVDSVITNLENQKTYWSSYNDNIQTVLGYSGEIEGLSDMVAEFGDGSAESVNMIAGMAAAAEAGDASKIQEMVTAWQDNKTAQDEAAQSLGDLVSGYSAGMDEIGQEIAQAVQDMDKTSESYAAAQSTIQGFIDGANAMLPSVQAAYARIGQAAANALRANQPSMPTGRGYASGTDNATLGWHRVGENGPETIWFNGGEVVWNARETSEFMKAMEAEPVAATSGSYGDAYVHLTYAPQYNLSGVSDTAEIRAMLAEYDEEMKQQIREMLAEESENAARRAYV